MGLEAEPFKISPLGLKLVATLGERFLDRNIAFNEEAFCIATIPGIHREFGAITRVHVGNHDEDIDQNAREGRIVGSVLMRLSDVFAERSEFLRTLWGGGCGPRGSGKGDVFVWSGPVAKT